MRVEVFFILFVYFEELNFGKFVSDFVIFYVGFVFGFDCFVFVSVLCFSGSY